MANKEKELGVRIGQEFDGRVVDLYRRKVGFGKSKRSKEKRKRKGKRRMGRTAKRARRRSW